MGIANWHKHRKAKVCDAQKGKTQKKAASKATQAFMSGYFKKGPPAKTVPSTVQSLNTVRLEEQSTPRPASDPSVHMKETMKKIAPSGLQMSTTGPKAAIPEETIVTSNPVPPLLQELEYLVANLPESVPFEVPGEGLSLLVLDLKGLDNPAIEKDDLWQQVVNPTLKSALGWGKFDERLLRRGDGMNNLPKLVRYFVCERGMDVALFEGKLSLLMEKMRAM